MSTLLVSSPWTAWQQSVSAHLRNTAPRYIETIRRNALLGFTCFGGPAVHVQIVSLTGSLLMEAAD